MKYFIKNMLATSVAVIFYIAASAQQFVASDISVTGLSLTAAGPVKKTPAISDNNNPMNRAITLTTSNDILKCSITVHNGSGFTRQTTLVVQLPLDVSIVSNPSNAIVNNTAVQNRGGTPGSVVFDLFNLSPNSDISVEFSFTKSTSGNKIGAYVYSACPDPDPSNNYKTATY